MKKIIVNCCYGGYGWSKQALEEIERRAGKRFYESDFDDRTDPISIGVLEEFGAEWCSAQYADLNIEEYDDTAYEPIIEEYDGFESIRTKISIPREHLNSLNREEIIELLNRIGAIRHEG